jgi:hypothetical protein
MALTLSEIQAATNDYLYNQGKVSDIYFKTWAILWVLMKMKDGAGYDYYENEGLVGPGDLADNGEKIRVPLSYQPSNWGGYGNTTKISKVKVDTANAARWDWGSLYSSNTIDKDTRIQNGVGKGGEAVMFSIIEEKITSIQKSIRYALAQNCYETPTSMASLGGGATGDYFPGLEYILGQATGTAVGGINQDDMAKWAQNKYTTTTTVNYNGLIDIQEQARVGSGTMGVPDVILGPHALVAGYKKSLQSQQRFGSNDKTAKAAAAGFKSVMLDEAMVIGDSLLDSGELDKSGDMFALNTKHFKIMTHPLHAFTDPVWNVDGVEEPDTLTADSRWTGALVTDYRTAGVWASDCVSP